MGSKPVVLGIAVAGVVLVALVLGLRGRDAPQEDVKAPQSTPAPSLPAPGPAPEPLITLAEFEALRTDMTYGQVVDIIGEVETDARSEYDRGVPGYTEPVLTAWYTWSNSDGSSATLGFISNKLAKKMQDGLK